MEFVSVCDGRVSSLQLTLSFQVHMNFLRPARGLGAFAVVEVIYRHDELSGGKE